MRQNTEPDLLSAGKRAWAPGEELSWAEQQRPAGPDGATEAAAAARRSTSSLSLSSWSMSWQSTPRRHALAGFASLARTAYQIPGLRRLESEQGKEKPERKV